MHRPRSSKARGVIHVLKIIINNSNIRIKRAIVTDEPKRMKAK